MTFLFQKEVIARPEHLATLLGLQLRPQKMEVLFHDRMRVCSTDCNLNRLTISFLLQPVSTNRGLT